MWLVISSLEREAWKSRAFPPPAKYTTSSLFLFTLPPVSIFISFSHYIYMNTIQKMSVVAYTCHHSPQEAEAGEL